MNGGKKEDFEEMNMDDIQTIYATYNAYQNALVHKISTILLGAMGATE